MSSAETATNLGNGYATDSGGFDGLTLLKSATSGGSSFGEAMSYFGLASAYDSQAGFIDIESDSILATKDIVAKQKEAQAKKFSGTQRMAYAKSGVTFEGSPMLVMAESEKNMRWDILTTKLNYVKEANRLGWQSVQAKMAAGRARTAGVAKVGEGVLNMVSSYAQMAG